MKKALGTLTTRVTSTEEKLSATSKLTPEAPPFTEGEGTQPRETLPPVALDGLLDVKEQVRVRLAERLTATPTGYLINTDEDSGQVEPP